MLVVSSVMCVKVKQHHRFNVNFKRVKTFRSVKPVEYVKNQLLLWVWCSGWSQGEVLWPDWLPADSWGSRLRPGGCKACGRRSVIRDAVGLDGGRHHHDQTEPSGQKECHHHRGLTWERRRSLTRRSHRSANALFPSDVRRDHRCSGAGGQRRLRHHCLHRYAAGVKPRLSWLLWWSHRIWTRSSKCEFLSVFSSFWTHVLMVGFCRCWRLLLQRERPHQFHQNPRGWCGGHGPERRRSAQVRLSVWISGELSALFSKLMSSAAAAPPSPATFFCPAGSMWRLTSTSPSRWSP